MKLKLTQTPWEGKAGRSCYIPVGMIIFGTEKEDGTSKIKVYVEGGARSRGHPPVFNVYVTEPLTDIGRRLGHDFVVATEQQPNRKRTHSPGGRRILLAQRFISFAHVMAEGTGTCVFLKGIEGLEDGDMAQKINVWESPDQLFRNRLL